MDVRKLFSGVARAISPRPFGGGAGASGEDARASEEVARASEDSGLGLNGEGLNGTAGASCNVNPSYRVARRNRNAADNPVDRSGNSAVMDSTMAGTHIRDGYRNIPQIKRTIDVYRDLVVGSGMGAYADPITFEFGWNLKKLPRELLLSMFDYALESDEVFSEWANEPSACHVDGRLSFADMIAMCITENAQVGDAFIIPTYTRGLPMPLQLQLIERDQLDVCKDRPATRGQNAIINGIEFDESGREIGAWFYDVHPHDDTGYGAGTFRSTFIRADRYWHLFRMTRPSQWIGATWLHAMGQPTRDRDKFLAAELRTAIKAALFLLYAKRKNAGGDGLGLIPDLPCDPGDIALGTNPIAADMLPDEDVKLVESARPNASAGAFFDLIDHDSAAATNLSYYSLTGRFERTNYTGFRGALQLEDAQITPVQNWLARQLVLPIRRRFNELAIALGLMTTAGPADLKRYPRRYRRFDVIGPGRNLIDPDKENEAAMGMIRGGLSTLKIECARRGLHWIHVLRQIYLENLITDELGIVLDHSKGQGGQSGKNSRSGDEEKEQEEEAHAA